MNIGRVPLWAVASLSGNTALDSRADHRMRLRYRSAAGMLCVRSFSCWARTHAVSSGPRAVSWRIGTG